MFQTSFNKGNRSNVDSWQKPENPTEHVTDAGEPHNARMKLSPVITNIVISLLVMAFFATCLHS